MGSRKYSTQVDIWSVGCIFAEMSTGRPLFPGTSESDQLDRIFTALGTPNEEIYPGIVELPEWKTDYRKYPKPPSLKHLAPNLDPLGIELLSLMLKYDPSQRIDAKSALEHPYFDDLPSSIKDVRGK
jgi:cyclin-dependent kinase